MTSDVIKGQKYIFFIPNLRSFGQLLSLFFKVISVIVVCMLLKNCKNEMILCGVRHSNWRKSKSLKTFTWKYVFCKSNKVPKEKNIKLINCQKKQLIDVRRNYYLIKDLTTKKAGFLVVLSVGYCTFSKLYQIRPNIKSSGFLMNAIVKIKDILWKINNCLAEL